MDSPRKPLQPRLPTHEEKDELWRYLCRDYSFKAQDLADTEAGQLKGCIEDAAIAVFDNYISDGPGYAGKVMLVVWPGGPDLREAFIWETTRNGDTKSYQLTRIP